MYYQNIITEKSWEILKKLKKEFEFILIGGWAVYLYTKSLKSKDIDIIIDFPVLDKLRKSYDVVKNDKLKKYQINKEGIDIDIYLPFYSRLGIPVEDLMKHETTREAFKILSPETLLITKQNAYLERKGSIKGEKDKIDLISILLLPDFDFTLYKKLLKSYKLDFIERLREILATTVGVKELNLNKHYFAKAKKTLLAKLA